jgi:hypothetical protein
MLLFFSAARVVFLGQTLRHLEEGHAELTRRAFAEFGGELPLDIDHKLLILSNQRMDMPPKRADGTISLFGLARSLIRAQTLPKYQHGMRQAWNHPTRTLPKVQTALYDRLLATLTAQESAAVSVRLGQAFHTLQDTYTIGHVDREDQSDPFSLMLRLHYSPSRTHPLISAHDRIWADEASSQLTPEAQAAIQASLAWLEVWAGHWRSSPKEKGQAAREFVARYAPIAEANP